MYDTIGAARIRDREGCFSSSSQIPGAVTSSPPVRIRFPARRDDQPAQAPSVLFLRGAPRTRPCLTAASLSRRAVVIQMSDSRPCRIRDSWGRRLSRLICHFCRGPGCPSAFSLRLSKGNEDLLAFFFSARCALGSSSRMKCVHVLDGRMGGKKARRLNSCRPRRAASSQYPLCPPGLIR